MEERQSAFNKKLDRKVLDCSSAPRASWHLSRTAIGGVLAASFVLVGVLCIGIPTHILNIGNPVVRNQANAPAAAPSPDGTLHLINAAFSMPPSSAAKDNSAALIAKGKQLFQAHTCSSCHGPKAQGTAIAPPLAGIGHYFNEATFSSLIHHPRPAMSAKGMPPATLSDKETHALWTYLNSMPVPAHRAPGVPAVVIFKKTSAKPVKSTTPSDAIATFRHRHRTVGTSA